MKKLTGIMMLAALSMPFGVKAQKKDESHLKQDVKKVADTVSNNTKEAAANSAAMIVDKVYADKTGPHGETIYMDKHAKYYYINSEGKKVYITKSKMKAKPRK
jgi:hypothetical protein